MQTLNSLFTSISKLTLDRLGISLSLLCALHCIGSPLLMFFAPWLGESFGSELFHIIMVLMITPLALFVFIKTLKKHGDKIPLKYGVSGIVFLIFGLAFHEIIPSENLAVIMERLATTVGSGLLIYAHIKNIKSCRCHYH